MRRFVLSLALLAAFSAPAGAASYSAKLAAPASGRIVARDINWACAGDTCQGSTAESRPAVLCQALAKRGGKVESFFVDGRAFSDAELTSCNASLKAGNGKALAAQ